MTVVLTDDARQHIAVFEAETEATARDCVLDEEYDRVIFVVPPGEMGQAIGPGGHRVRRLEETLGRDVELVEAADEAADFVANALSPAAVLNVTMSENDDLVAYVEVAHEDRGVAIGTDGRNIQAARLLADRHFGVDDVQLT